MKCLARGKMVQANRARRNDSGHHIDRPIMRQTPQMAVVSKNIGHPATGLAKEDKGAVAKYHDR